MNYRIKDIPKEERPRERLKEVGANLLIKTLDGIVDGTIIREKQEEEREELLKELEKEENSTDNPNIL